MVDDTLIMPHTVIGTPCHDSRMGTPRFECVLDDPVLLLCSACVGVVLNHDFCTPVQHKLDQAQLQFTSPVAAFQVTLGVI